MDGNFKAQRMNVSNKENEVNLSKGEGFFVQHDPYHKYLLTAKDIPYVSIPF